MIRKEHIQNKYHVNASKIYFSGMSGGGIFCFLLASQIPEKIAALAIIAGNIAKPNTLADAPPMPLLYIHGTSDFIYHGTKDLITAEQTVDFWIKHNKCDTVPKLEKLEDENNKDKSSVTKLFYRSTIGADVVFYKIHNGGHHWPNSRFNANNFVDFDLGILNKDFDANQAIWDFVSDYSKKQNSQY